MTEAAKSESATVLAVIETEGRELTLLPDRAGDDLQRLTPEQRQEVDRIKQDLDVTRSEAIMTFGSIASGELRRVSNEMLEGVRNKDIGPAGESLNQMVKTLRGFDLSDIAEGKTGLVSRFLALIGAKVDALAEAMQRYEEVNSQIHAIENGLVTHANQMLTDVALLDRQYEAAKQEFRRVELHILAGEECLRHLETDTIPSLEAAVDALPEERRGLKVQELADLRERRNELERRLHDLRLTRQILLQSLPTIKMIQTSDKSLIAKIVSMKENTIPAWEQQIALAIAMDHQRRAAADIGAASDFTNDLMKKNADALQQGTAEVRREIERGIIDIETVTYANDRLIATIEDSRQVLVESRAARLAAVRKMSEGEAQLVASLR